nr:palindromic element RPE2 domain-containing protein [Rickettsia slovaca]
MTNRKATSNDVGESKSIDYKIRSLIFMQNSIELFSIKTYNHFRFLKYL